MCQMCIIITLIYPLYTDCTGFIRVSVRGKYISCMQQYLCCNSSCSIYWKYAICPCVRGHGQRSTWSRMDQTLFEEFLRCSAHFFLIKLSTAIMKSFCDCSTATQLARPPSAMRLGAGCVDKVSKLFAQRHRWHLAHQPPPFLDICRPETGLF